MEEEFLRKYYSVGKTVSVRKAIHEFTQGARAVLTLVTELTRSNLGLKGVLKK